MKNAMRILQRGLALGLAVMLCLAAAAWAEDDGTTYIKNQWNFVDGSMDVSNGIPDDAAGVLEKIRRAGVLRVATEPYYPPQEFIDPTRAGQDQYVGADMTLARLIAKRMGVELEIVPMEFVRVLTAVSEGECDLAISALAFTPARASMVELSKGYYFAESGTTTGLLVRTEDLAAYTGIESLADKTFVAQSGSLQEALAAKHITAYQEFRRLSSAQSVFRAVQEKRADAALVETEAAKRYIEKMPQCGLSLVPGVSFLQEPEYEGDRIAGKKGELQLMYFVNGVIDEVLASGQYDKWFEEYDGIAARIGQ